VSKVSRSWLPREFQPGPTEPEDVRAELERLFSQPAKAKPEPRLQDVDAELPEGLEWPLNWPEVVDVLDYGCCALTTTSTLNRSYGQRWLKDPTFVYIGRMPQYGSDRFGNIFGNPFHVGGVYVNNEVAVARFRDYILEHRPADILMAIPDLGGKILACHCVPKACHGEVIAELVQSYVWRDGVYDDLLKRPLKLIGRRLTERQKGR